MKSSSLSLASSSLTSVGVEDVRHLSNNYEQLLHQATASIKKLKKEKGSLESEQDRLLTVNIELATEVKRLLQQDKENKKEREVSVHCNYLSHSSLAHRSYKPSVSSYKTDL